MVEELDELEQEQSHFTRNGLIGFGAVLIIYLTALIGFSDRMNTNAFLVGQIISFRSLPTRDFACLVLYMSISFGIPLSMAGALLAEGLFVRWLDQPTRRLLDNVVHVALIILGIITWLATGAFCYLVSPNFAATFAGASIFIATIALLLVIKVIRTPSKA